MRARTFLRELRRRRVFRVAVAYLAGGFVLLQVAETVLPPIGWDTAHTAVVVLVLGGLPVALVLAWIFDVSPEGLVVTPDLEEAPAGLAVATAPEAPRYPATALAVLPFKNVGGDADDEYFAEGIHDDLLASLSRIRGLKVISRTSVTSVGPRGLGTHEIAHRLRVGSIVEGSVRRAGRRVRIVARLVDTASDSQVWAETYDRGLEDVFEIQSDVARHIAHALSIRLSDDESRRLATTPTQSLEAYDLYLRGRFQWNRRTEAGLTTSVDLLRRAVELDPDFALAHAGLADAWATLGIYNVRAPSEVMPAAETAASRALDLDPALAEALTARGCVRSLYAWDWEAADEDFRRARATAPAYATGHHWHAINHLALRGRFAEAHEALRIAGDLDPDAPAIEASVGFLLFLERRYPEAEHRLSGLTAAHPDFAMGHFFLGGVLERSGRWNEALASLEAACELRGRSPEALAALAQTLAFAGRRAESDDLVRAMRASAVTRWVSPTRFAQIAFAAGDMDAGFSGLRAAVDARAVDLPWMAIHPAFDAVRADFRFDEVREALRLP